MACLQRSILLISLLSFLLSTGCADDLRHRNLFDGGAGDVMLSFSVENISLTRTDDGMDLETAIDHAYLLFYPSDAVFETDVPVAAVRAEVSADNHPSLTFKMPLRLDPDTDYRLLAVANADSYVPEGFSNYKEYLESWVSSPTDIRQPLHLYHSAPLQAGEVERLPMRGGIMNDGYFRFTRQDGAYKVSASLLFRRNVARIDVANLVKEGFLIEGIALCNWRDAVSVAKADSQLGNRTGSIRGILSSDSNESEEVSFVVMPSADANGVQQLKESIYCFPSVTYESHTSDRQSTALIIKARYGEDTESSYYRVNVGMTGNKSEIKENTKYLVTIQSVKGSGASTPQEAYASEESPIVLSVVEDWDLEGCFAMDEEGNFIVLSTGHLEFDGNEIGRKEVRVLTSKGLSWAAQYVADDEVSVSAFAITVLSDISMAIGPTEKNDGDQDLSGRISVSAATPDGGLLSVDISVSQHPSSGTDDPSIPEDMPFALIPLSKDRVKIDHNARTIEIDGFDPDCFNSFIDIPFAIYVNPSEQPLSFVNVSTNLEWPLEGRISLEKSESYSYCKESFASVGLGKVESVSGSAIDYNVLCKNPLSINLYGEDEGVHEIVYVSVGAMGPDDPDIIREISIDGGGKQISYSLTLTPGSVIIDDVILSDDEGTTGCSYWIIQDRNIQEVDKYRDYIGLNSLGIKPQAYNFSHLEIKTNVNSFTIPFKFMDANTPFMENQHELYQGCMDFFKANTPSTNQNRTKWLKFYSESGDFSSFSPFYAVLEDNPEYEKWIYPTQEVVELWRKKLKVSKMRFYFISDYCAKTIDKNIPICCYLPYWTIAVGDKSSETYGYFKSVNGIVVNGVVLLYFDKEKVIAYNLPSSKSSMAFSRLVRPLTKEELESYKNNYLGYGSQPHRLQLCHPDTYESTSLGWLEK